MNGAHSCDGGVAGRTILITGAGQGIGRVLAKAFALEGAMVVVADRDEASAEATAADIVAAHGTAMAVCADIGDEASVASMQARIDAECGGVDVLINNAALFSSLKMQLFEEIPLDVWQDVQHVNVTGPFLCAKAVVPGMKTRKFGRIVNISSGAVTLGRPNYLHYTTSKAALIGMTRSMARELGAYGITVNAVLPGSVATEIHRETVTAESKRRIVEMQCIPRGQIPEDLIGIMLFLAGSGSEFMTGQSITVDGGATHL